MAHPLDPDTALYIRLLATVERYLGQRMSHHNIVTWLKDAANGRDDLLAKAAGTHLASDRFTEHDLLMRAGGWRCPEIAEAATTRARRNLGTMYHTSAGTQSRR